MEFTMQNKAPNLLPSKSLVMAKANRDVIFNTANFLEIYSRLTNLQATAQRQWGKMTVIQMLNHLKIATGSGLKVYTLKDESSFLSRGIIRFIALRVLNQLPKNVKGPKGFEFEMNEAIDFNAEKEQALIMLKKAHLSAQASYAHPMFGTMPRALWGRLIYRHFDHHLRQFGA
jgi:hypothetical protein